VRGRSGESFEDVGQQSDRGKHESISACEGIDRVRIDERASGDKSDEDDEVVEWKKREKKREETVWWRLGILQSCREGRVWHIFQGLRAGEQRAGCCK
jgi:hypothetical protein